MLLRWVYCQCGYNLFLVCWVILILDLNGDEAGGMDGKGVGDFTSARSNEALT